MKTAVFFDAGGTLLRPWPSVGAVYARVAIRHGIRVTEEKMESAFRRAWSSQKRSTEGLTVSRRSWWEQLVAEVVREQAINLSERTQQEYFEDLYGEFTEPNAWRVFADVVPTLEELRRRGVYVGLISNWDDRLRPLLRKLGLAGYFDALTISSEVGIEKPAAGIFHAALRSAQRKGTDCLHIGDSAGQDVAGAAQVGIQGLLIDREQRCNPDDCRLIELQQVLEWLAD